MVNIQKSCCIVMFIFCSLVIYVNAAVVHGYDKRIFDVTSLPVESIVTKAGENKSLSCPGVTEHSLVLALEWLSYSSQLKLVEFMSDTTTVWVNQDRVSLTLDSFSLSFHPTAAEDSGEYVCLVNSRPKPDALVRLIVQDVPDPPGRPLIMSFTSRSVNLSWAPSQDTHHSGITHYIIHTRVGEDTEWNAIEGILTPANGTNYQLTLLHPYTVYSFRVVAVNALGASLPSKESYYMVTLREVPAGKPIITTAHNTSASAIHISWRPPHADTIHGEFLGYRISYRPRDRGADSVKEIYIRDSTATSHTIQKLETYTQYLVSLQVFNPEGPGPSTTVRVMTDEGAPSKPVNVTVKDINTDTIQLKWSVPEKENGAILGYRVYYMYGNYTDVKWLTVESGTKNIYYNLTNLRPYTMYKIFVKAYTQRNEGEQSETIVNRTDISGPNAPRMLNLTCQNADTIFLQWERPTQFLNSIDYYYIYISGVDDNGVLESSVDNSFLLYDNITLPSSTEHLETSYFIKNVTTNTKYLVQLGAATLSQQTGRLLAGLVSDGRVVHMRPNCDQIQQYRRQSTGDLSAGMIAGVVCAAVAFFLAMCAFVLWRKCFHAAYYYLDDPPCSVPTSYLDWNAVPEGGEHKGAISVSVFPRHVAELHADGDIGFSKEYEAIQTEAATGGVAAVISAAIVTTTTTSSSTMNTVAADGSLCGAMVPVVGGTAAAVQSLYTSEHSQHPDNRAKNRYLNIIAYDHSRVQLLQMPGQKKNIDYINANYIDGFQWLKAYIGTQGPLPSTFDCFWRMVWEQRVNIIVMITNLVERGRRKCDMYWPKEGTETYGVIQVRLVKEDVMATYTVRTLLIRHLKIKKKKQAMAEKYVYQYHYTNWPDHGTPDHPLPVLHFVKKSAAANPPDAGPIIVHCSAGVGRTGTYIVLDAMIRQIRARNEVNVCGFLRHIRTQRNFLVQTEEQYIFIHDALVEAIESGETNVAREQFAKYAQLLFQQQPPPPPSSQQPLLMGGDVAGTEKGSLWRSFEHQFKLATSFQCRDFNVVSAHKAVNVPKNRHADLVPVESARVHLTPKPGEDGSDYVNATWLQGFGSLREFIVTQHPLAHTSRDFWQMVWDHNAQMIIVLSAVDGQDFEVFWPIFDMPVDADNYKVRLVHEQTHHTSVAGHIVYVTRDFTMQSLQDDYELNVRMVHGANWPHQSGSGGGGSVDMLAFPAMVQSAQLGYQNGPVVVVDRYGGAEAATFCCLATLRKHLHHDNHLDVYMYAKLYHNKRPGIWSTLDDYVRLHRALYALCTTPAAINAVPVPLQMQSMSSQACGSTIHGEKLAVTPDLYANANGIGIGVSQQQQLQIDESPAGGNIPLMPGSVQVLPMQQQPVSTGAVIVNGSLSNDSVRVPPEEAPLIPDVTKMHIHIT